ncbi:MAG: hypothetical protein WCE96_05585 [Nitrososphaeraceae archaeon]
MVKKTHNTYCIIGDPINHSLSPALHNAAFNSLGLDHSLWQLLQGFLASLCSCY